MKHNEMLNAEKTRLLPPFRDLRTWIDALQKEGMLYENEQEMFLRDDIAYISKQIADENGPAVLHTNIHGYPGWRVFHDGLTTPARQALALGQNTKNYAPFLFDVVCKDRRMPPEIIADAPCKEIILTGDQIDLTALPVPATTTYENPPYITAGISHVITPDKRWQNIAIRRYQLQSEKDLTVLAMVHAQHEGQILNQYFLKNEQAPVVIVIGADPLYYFCAQMPAPDNVSEFEFWGALAGEPLRMVRSEMFPDILIPASAEIVIEGYYQPTERLLEGPFSEFPGFHSGLFYLPKLEVKTITMRHDAIYQYMYMGREPTEGHNLDHLVYSANMYAQFKSAIPEVVDVAALATEGFTTAISIKKSANRPGLVRRLALAVRGSKAGMVIKNLIVVDDDLDVRNINDLLWAFSVRFQGQKDILTIHDLPGCFLDPSEASLPGGPGITSYAVFDLTEPLPPFNEGYKRGKALPTLTDRAAAVLAEIRRYAHS